MKNAASHRWRRLSDLVSADMDQFRLQMVEYENKLSQIQADYDGLCQYFIEASDTGQHVNASLQGHQLSAQREFVDSLRTAIDQQKSILVQGETQLEKLREHMTLLYQKKESYTLLETSAIDEANIKMNRNEQKNQDELAQNMGQPDQDF